MLSTNYALTTEWENAYINQYFSRSTPSPDEDFQFAVETDYDLFNDKNREIIGEIYLIVYDAFKICGPCQIL